MTDRIILWAFYQPEKLGITALDDSPPVDACPLNVPLIILAMLEELYLADVSLVSKYMNTSRKCAKQVLQHSVQVYHSPQSPTCQSLAGDLSQVATRVWLHFFIPIPICHLSP